MKTLINAGPGTGKTFTLTFGYLTLSRQLVGKVTPTDEQADIFNFLTSEFDSKSSVCFFSHNNSTKDNLKKKLPKTANVYTFHGAGQSTLIKRYGFQRLVYDRTDKFIGDITGHNLRDMPAEIKSGWYAIKKLVNYFKIEFMEPTEENYNYICFKYPDMASANVPSDWRESCIKLLERSAIPNKTVEFTDMLWMGARTAKKKYDIGFVDESQDISACSYALVDRLCHNVVFCGDRNQAINAFAGASEEMYTRIADKADAIHPLKMTQRCPAYICDMANHIRPNGIIHGPNKQEGKHETITYDSLPEKMQECRATNTLIISRTNAAVISCAIKLHKLGIPCRIVDRDLADEVKFFINSFFTKDLSKLLQRLQTYEDKGTRSKNLLWAQMVRDKCTYTKELINAVSSYSELLELLKDTFEKHPNGFPLSSIHKAKGLEALNIFVLNPPVELACCMEHPIAKEQEINLHFVAVTRSALNLYWVK
jgi:superfamily I DNA/RNA helicase